MLLTLFLSSSSTFLYTAIEIKTDKLIMKKFNIHLCQVCDTPCLQSANNIIVFTHFLWLVSSKMICYKEIRLYNFEICLMIQPGAPFTYMV